MSVTSLPRTTRKLLSLALIGVLGVPGILDTKQVTVEVDGTPVRDVRTHADTVDELLARQGIDVSAADDVVPPLDTPLEQVTAISIDKAIEVRVVDQLGRAERVLAPVDTIADVLDRVDLPADTQLARRPPDAPVIHGDSVRVRVPVPVRLIADAGLVELTSADATVGDVLAAEGIRLGPADMIAPALDTPVEPDMVIGITRFGGREEIEEVALPFEEERRETSELVKGATRVLQEGVEGLRRDTYEVTVIDGRDVARDRIASEVLTEPVTRIVEVGTRVPKPAELDRTWVRLAQCESGGRWSYNGRYDGGLQFHPSTWNRWKPAGYPDYAWQATAAQQITVGKRLQAARGWNPWPSCARKLGLL